mgnify:FL=1
MKYLFIGVFTLLCLFACQSNDSQYIIEGTLPTAQQDGEWIYLAPMENASIENIDSTRIENARFTFQGTGEEMKVLRMRILLRLKFQELLVVTEPGVTSVRIDSISSASGTPQNDALQHWKDRKQKTDGESYALWTALKTCSPEDSTRIKQTWDSLRVETQAFNYAFMKEHINQTVGKFLYKMIKTSLTEEQRKELDEANH